jgi:hypothetical protein
VSVYRLDPIPERLSDRAWKLSVIAEAVWVGALFPSEARELVAEITANVAGASGPEVRSPWLNAELTTCVWHSEKDDVALGAVRTVAEDSLL